MKKKVLRSIICFLLSVIMIIECNLGAINVYAAEITEEETGAGEHDSEEVVEEEIITASSYLYPFEEAVISLEELAAKRNIPAVVYLTDIITMRMLPEESSEPVKNLISGDVVRIIGAGQDAEYNIWYQISYQDEIEEVTGFVRKDNVACVDEEFVKWQENYVRSIGMFNRLRSGYSTDDIETFPESYKEALYALKQKHPNWIFVKMPTNLDWNYTVENQHGERSYIWAPTAKDSWKDGMTGSTNWAYASRGIIKYYLDPRNWLSEKNVFQFEMLSYASKYHTVEAVQSILTGTFMENAILENGKTYSQTFVELGNATTLSPILMAARVRQEQGVNGNGALISGTYEGYEGYYNYYNIGATGKNDKETIINGLKTAVEKGWNSRYLSLKGGAEFIAGKYVKAGQDTLYLQKFNVGGKNGVFTNQYMQNIQAPSTESISVYNAYKNKGLLEQTFIFRIPVYNNMPGKAAPKPGEEDKITLSSSEINNLQVDSEITLYPLVNGKEAEGLNWNFTSSSPEVATVDNNGVVKAVKAGETTITCKCVDDPDNPNVGSCKVTVIPANIDILKLDIPVLKNITYNPDTTLKDIALPSGYTWVNPDMVPVAAKSSYGVIYNPNEEKYNPITFDITLQVDKKVLTSAEYTIPEDLEGGAGRELNSVALPIGFYWNNPAEKLADTIGTKEYLASYNPDNANYETVTDIKIPVKIVCEKHEFGEWVITEASCETDGSKIRKCTICGSKEELILEKIGHLYESEITVEATEEAEGTRTYICKNCGNSYTESIPKLPSTHVHQYEETVIKKASCTEAGEKAFECSCGDTYTEIIDATGHKVENGRCQQCGYTDVIETPDSDETTGNSSTDGDKTSEGGNADINKPNEGGNADTDKPSEGGNADTDKPSEDGNADTDKPSEGGNADTDKPSEGGNADTDKPSEGGNADTDKPSDVGNSNTNDGSGNNDSNVNNGGTNSDSTNNSSTINNGNTSNNNITNNNTTTNTVINNPTTDDNVEKNKADNTVDEDKIEENSTQTTIVSNASQTQTATINKTNQVEVELMSDLIENVKEESVEGEKQTVSIQLNKNTEISQKIVEMAKEHGVDLEVKLSNELKWTIKADSLSMGMPSAVNMNAEIVQDVIEKGIIDTVANENEYMELSLSHDGEFGFEATLTIPVEEKYASQIANLFYFNEKTKELEFQMAAPVDDDNNIQLEFNHASDYVIVFALESMAEVVTDIADSTDSIAEETTKEIVSTESEKKDTNKLLVVCFVVMILAGGLAGAGYFIYFNKKEISDGQDFEEWLKEDAKPKVEEVLEKKAVLKKEKKSESIQDEYLDDDIDDYKEKDVVTINLTDTGRSLIKNEIESDEYLDDDVDDYKEKYLDDDTDDYKEKM